MFRSVLWGVIDHSFERGILHVWMGGLRWMGGRGVVHHIVDSLYTANVSSRGKAFLVSKSKTVAPLPTIAASAPMVHSHSGAGMSHVFPKTVRFGGGSPQGRGGTPSADA